MSASAPAQILVGVDGSERGADALTLAESLARGLGAEVVVAHVYPRPAPGGGDEGAAELRDAAEGIVSRAAERLAELPSLQTRLVSAASPARGLYALAEEQSADLVVIASTHRSPLGRALLGGVAERLLQGAPCAIAVAPVGWRERAGEAPALVGVAYDGLPEAETALAFAATLAGALGARMRLWFAIAPTGGEEDPRRYGEYAAQIRGWATEILERGRASLPAGVAADEVVLEGDPARAIAHAAAVARADLLVCGSRGYGPAQRVLLGATSSALIREAPCPVVVVPRGSDGRHPDPAL
jgi:nucleotide-binding universal stress UspA family protein